MYIGNEQFQVGGHTVALTVNDFWRWAFSEFSVPAVRTALAEFLTASALDMISSGRGHAEQGCDLLWTAPDGENIRVGVHSAAFIRPDDTEHPERVIFDTPAEQSCNVHVFGVCKALTRNESPLNTDLWDFYSIPERKIGKNMANLSLASLMRLELLWSDYYGIAGAVLSVLSKS